MVLGVEGADHLDHSGVTFKDSEIIEQSLLHHRTNIKLQGMKAVLLVRVNIESIFPAVSTGVGNVSEDLQCLLMESVAFDCDVASVLCDAALSPL